MIRQEFKSPRVSATAPKQFTACFWALLSLQQQSFVSLYSTVRLTDIDKLSVYNRYKT